MKSKKPSPKSKLNAQQPQASSLADPLSPQEKLAQATADHEKWSQVAAKPGLSPTAAAWAQAQARSAWAEMELRQKASVFQQEPGPPDLDPNLSRLLLSDSQLSPEQTPPGSEKTTISAPKTLPDAKMLSLQSQKSPSA